VGVPVKGLKKDENTYQLNENTLERIYAGWLGKVIGIRMGAPVEGWSSEEIQKKYGELWDYPVDYGNFAADDDSNGPVFLVRALEQVEPGRKLTAQDVAEALLNYAPYEHGFFWWGGYGLSTEHTAYLNLRQGIPAPLSGSIQKNGKTMAELDLSKCIGPCQVLKCPSKVSREILESALRPEEQRLLLKGARELDEGAAEFLVERGILCIGVESLSVAPLSSPVKVHKLLLGAEIIILEGLVLEEVPEGRYELIALPLKMEGLDGSPVRAVLRELTDCK